MSTQGTFMSDAQRREIVFSGRVQGVGFRATTASLARSFAVRGFVRNLESANVELVVEGEPAEIDRFIQSLRSVFDRHIRDARQQSLPPTGEFDSFSIRY